MHSHRNHQPRQRVTSSHHQQLSRNSEDYEGNTAEYRYTSFLLPTFTHGYSVDNAVHERMFKAAEIWKALKKKGVEEKVGKNVMVIPGLADKERNSIRQMTGWNVMVGPISGCSAPLFILKNRDEFL